MSRSRRKPASDTPPDTKATDIVPSVARMLVVASLVVRWLLPTEASAAGDTLPIVQLTLLAGAVWGWAVLRGSVPRVRLDGFDVALGAILVGQVVGTIGVFAFGGDRRAAVNVTWEWVGVVGTFFLLRQLVASTAARTALVRVIVSITVGVSVLGIWQHFVWYPQTARQYVADRDELDGLRSRASLSPTDANRLRELLQQFEANGVPLEGPGRKAFESRLLGSSEPLGRFALANTLAGWMLPGTLSVLALAVSLMGDPRRRFGWKSIAAAVCVALVLYCLLLTKSRTAYVGLACGVAVWGVLRFGGRWPLARVIPWLAGIAVLAGLGFGLAFATGGLDREVIAEAPRSLRFRLQYWVATWDVIGERPLFGTGPGNFRQHYTRYKLPEASEDIADPHNFVFEIWATTGPTGLLALLAVVTLAGRRVLKTRTVSEDDCELDTESDSVAARDVAIGATGGVLLAAGTGLLFGTNGLSETGLVVVACAGSFGLLRIPSNALPAVGVAISGGLPGLGVHLLGAGGIGMPAVTLSALASLVCVWSPRTAADAKPAGGGSLAGLGLLLFGAGFVACLFSATRPVLDRANLVGEARSLVAAGRLPLAEKRFDEAVARDNWSPDAASTAASTMLSVSRSGLGRDLRRPLEWQREAVRRNPFSSSERGRLATIARIAFESATASNRTPVVTAEEVLSFYAAAVERAPTDVRLHVESAMFADSVGNGSAAVGSARRAIELDEVNRSAGHVDKLLEDDVLAVLRAIAVEKSAAESP